VLLKLYIYGYFNRVQRSNVSRFRFAVGTGWNFQNQLKLISLRGRNDKFIGAVDKRRGSKVSRHLRKYHHPRNGLIGRLDGDLE
jgi:hypothetical protein